MEISIDYLVPIMVNFKEKKIICMFDYKNSAVYYLQDNLDKEEKSKIESLIINKIDSKAMVDIEQPEIISIENLIKNLNINDIRNKYSNELQEEENV